MFYNGLCQRRTVNETASAGVAPSLGAKALLLRPDSFKISIASSSISSSICVSSAVRIASTKSYSNVIFQRVLLFRFIFNPQERTNKRIDALEHHICVSQELSFPHGLL
mmetsp:Transcript_6521/g.15404  ORF Transcript_6521/g.15404 Transcript_6521/m.15404 type:complete len:109 (+) Transcript_6521:128-454(+)